MMPVGKDWIFQCLAIALGLLGLWLLYWSLLRDRSRGRRRCPRCWYDMSGTPGNLTCSECGYVASRERKLQKTRRRWRWAFMALVIAIMAVGSAVTPALWRGEWKSLIPTTALILAMPGLDTSSPQLTSELEQRFKAGRLARWQIRLLFGRCVDANKPPWSIQFLTRAQWPQDVQGRYILRMSRQPSTILWVDGLGLRLRASPRTSGGSSTMVISAPYTFTCKWVDPVTGAGVDAANWKSRGGSLGSLAPGASMVTFDLALECEHFVPGAGRMWLPVWTGQQTINVTIAGRVEEVMSPVRSSAVDEIMRSRTWVMGLDSILRVRRTFGPIAELGERGAIGANFELRHDGLTVARTSGWWGNNDAPRLSEILPWEWKEPGIPAFQTQSQGEWSLIVSGDPRLALLAFDDKAPRDPDAVTYWDGQVTIPLRIGRPGGYLVPHGEPRPSTMWGWSEAPASTQRD